MIGFIFSVLILPLLAFIIALLCSLAVSIKKKTQIPKIEENLGNEDLVAMVCCTGLESFKKQEMIYEGPSSCKSKYEFFQGPNFCKKGCLGDGDCIETCPNKAISLRKGLAMVDPMLCNGCGLCIKSCPSGTLQLVSAKFPVMACSNPQKEEDASLFCDAACINCGFCEKSCPEKAILIDNKGFHLDSNLCTYCEICIQLCPKGLICIPRL